jgi:pimeloyl-ACP methyl ester carboxylesterase
MALARVSGRWDEIASVGRVDLQPRLIDVATPVDPVGVVVLLHGGASRGGTMRVSPTQLSVLRMVPIGRRVARAGVGRLAVFRLLNSRRGWDASHTPVQDAQWALDQLADRHGCRLPTCLVGHSLGGRAAILTAGRAEVRSVVALARGCIRPICRLGFRRSGS